MIVNLCFVLNNFLLYMKRFQCTTLQRYRNHPFLVVFILFFSYSNMEFCFTKWRSVSVHSIAATNMSLSTGSTTGTRVLHVLLHRACTYQTQIYANIMIIHILFRMHDHSHTNAFLNSKF